MKKCLIYLDETQMQNAIDMLDVASQIYDVGTYETFGLAINHDYQEAIGAFDHIISIQDSSIVSYDPMVVSQVMTELQELWTFDSILVPATAFGRMLAPRVAMALKVGLVADVTAIKKNGDVLEMIRPAYSGRMLAGITGNGHGPVMMSIRQGVFNYEATKDKTSNIIEHKPEATTSGGIKMLHRREKPTSYDIRESDVLISGGGGILKDFDKLADLADLLNAQVSASRKIVDEGIVTRNIQVGQSGKTVSPKLYVALGIYGAIQHVEGLKNVQHIISVNTNRHAPICSLSDIVVEGDGAQFIEKLTAKIKENM